MKKSLVTLIALLGLVLTGWADQTWKTSVASGLYSEPTNWKASAVPVSSEYGYFNTVSAADEISSYTVTFPVGGFTDTSCTYLQGLKNGQTLTFDTTGTFWYKGPGSMSVAHFPLFLCAGGTSSDFLRLHNQSANAEKPSFLMSNAVLSCSYSATDGSVVELSGGFLNYYDPYGLMTPSTLNVHIGRVDTNVVFKINGAAVRGNGMQLFDGETDIEGGEHKFFGDISLGGTSTTFAERDPVLEIHDAAVELGGHLKIGVVADMASATVNLKGDTQFLLTGSSKATAVGAANGAHAHLNLYDNALLSNTYVRVGTDGNSTAADGHLMLTNNAAIKATTAYVGFSSSSNVKGEMRMGGKSRLTVFGDSNKYGLWIGSGPTSATGVVSMVEQAMVKCENGSYVVLGGTAAAHGELSATDRSVLDIGNLYMGFPGTYSVNLSGSACMTSTYFAATWQAGSSGSAVLCGASQTRINGGVAIGHAGPCDFTMGDSASFFTSGAFALCDTASGAASVLLRDSSDLYVQNNLAIGHANGMNQAHARVQDAATVYVNNSLTIKGADSLLELAGGSLTTTESESHNAAIHGTSGTINGIRVSGGNHKLIYGGGVRVVSENSATADTVGRIELLGGRLAVVKMYGGAGSAAGGKTNGGTAVLYGAGGTLVACATDQTLLTKFDEATLGAGGLTLEVPEGISVDIAQAFVDESDVDGTVVKSGAGTLTVKTASAHAVTKVAAGMLRFDTGITQFGRKMVLTGGTFEPGAASVELGALQLGDADSVGTLILVPGSKLTVSEESGFTVGNGVIRFTSAPAVGDYDFLEVAGEIDPSAFDRIEVIDPSGANRYGFAITADQGKTSVRMSVISVESISDVNWQGDESGEWLTDGNWEGGAKPTALNNAVFPATAQTKAVTVADAAVADALRVTGGDYAFTGEGSLTAYGITVANGATAAVDVALAPKGQFTMAVAAGAALELTAPFARSPIGELHKDGSGLLTLGGTRPKNLLDWNVDGGTLRVESNAALGSEDETGLALRVGPATVSVTNDISLARRIIADNGEDAKLAILNVDKDVTLDGPLSVVGGGLVKRGAGELDVTYPEGGFTVGANDIGFIKNTVPNSAAFKIPAVLPETGDSPTGDAVNCFGGFNVLDGKIHLIGAGAEKTILTQPNWTLIGINYADISANAELHLSGLTWKDTGEYRRFVVGNVNYGTTGVVRPALRLDNGTVLNAQGLFLGLSYANDTYPTLTITNATMTVASQTYFGVAGGWSPKAHPVVRIGSGGFLKSNSITKWYALILAQNVDVDVADGGIIDTGANDPNGVILSHTACGRVAFRNGGKLSTAGFTANHNRHTSVSNLVVAFDSGILEINGNKIGGSHISAPGYRCLRTEGAGMEIRTVTDVRHELAFPLTGSAKVTKTGQGEFILTKAKDVTFSDTNKLVGTNDSDVIVAQWTGKTTVAEGTLVFEEGELVATKEVEVAAGATLELSNAETAYGFETLSGAGTIRNGTIGRCAIACDGTSALTFDNVTLGAVTVDFGHDETDPIDLATLAGLKVAQLDNGSTATKWKIAGTGQKNVRGTFVIQPDGSVILTEACLTGLLMIVR